VRTVLCITAGWITDGWITQYEAGRFHMLAHRGETVGTYTSLSTAEIVSLCSTGSDADAWSEFLGRFHRLIATVVLRTAARLGQVSNETADDLIQDTYLKLCADNFRLLRNFEERTPGAFIGYLKVVTANVVRDYFKSIHSKRNNEAVHSSESPDPALVPLNEEGSGSQMRIERELLINEIRRYLELCTAGSDQDRKRNVFWLYYRVGLSASAIASIPGIGLSTKGVESQIARITRDVRELMVNKSRAERSFGPDETAGEGIVSAGSF
jgi:RNA polymerase sigma-70 factor, ECF subfamily